MFLSASGEHPGKARGVNDCVYVFHSEASKHCKTQNVANGHREITGHVLQCFREAGWLTGLFQSAECVGQIVVF